MVAPSTCTLFRVNSCFSLEITTLLFFHHNRKTSSKCTLFRAMGFSNSTGLFRALMFSNISSFQNVHCSGPGFFKLYTFQGQGFFKINTFQGQLSHGSMSKKVRVLTDNPHAWVANDTAVVYYTSPPTHVAVIQTPQLPL